MVVGGSRVWVITRLWGGSSTQQLPRVAPRKHLCVCVCVAILAWRAWRGKRAASRNAEREERERHGNRIPRPSSPPNAPRKKNRSGTPLTPTRSKPDETHIKWLITKAKMRSKRNTRKRKCGKRVKTFQHTKMHTHRIRG